MNSDLRNIQYLFLGPLPKAMLLMCREKYFIRILIPSSLSYTCKTFTNDMKILQGPFKLQTIMACLIYLSVVCFW